MKNSIKIRLVLALVITTLLTIGLFMDIQRVAILYSVVCLLVIDTSELTRPIPRNEQWKVIIGVGVFLAVMFTSILLHLAYPKTTIWNWPHPNMITLRLIAVSLWILSLWGICRRWQTEKEKAAA